MKLLAGSRVCKQSTYQHSSLLNSCHFSMGQEYHMNCEQLKINQAVHLQNTEQCTDTASPVPLVRVPICQSRVEMHNKSPDPDFVTAGQKHFKIYVSNMRSMKLCEISSLTKNMEQCVRIHDEAIALSLISEIEIATKFTLQSFLLLRKEI